VNGESSTRAQEEGAQPNPLSWFDDLVSECPEAGKYRANLDHNVAQLFDIAKDEERKRIEAEKALQAVREEAASFMQDRARRFLIELVNANWDKGAAYNSAVISIGFVGLFAGWSQVADQMTNPVNRLVAIASIVSLAAFVAFEVYKMVIGHRLTMNLINHASRDRSAFDDEASRFIEIMSAANQGFHTYWKISVAVSLFFGLGAASIIVWSMFERFFI